MSTLQSGQGAEKARLLQSIGVDIGPLKSLTIFLFLLSAVVNCLALTGALYMLQIYDRALISQSLPTLAALTILALGLYIFQGSLDIIRTQILIRLGARLDEKLAPLTQQVVIDMPRFGHSLTEVRERGNDVDVVRNFLATQGPIALFDLPFVPLYIAFITLLHPWLGGLTVAGALFLMLLTLSTEIASRNRGKRVLEADIARKQQADSMARNAEVVFAMRFGQQLLTRYGTLNKQHLKQLTKLNDLTGSYTSLSKTFRMILQSAVLGLGAYLTIKGELTAGSIIAASVAAARALAPIDLAISHWKGLAIARRSYNRLKETLAAVPPNQDSIALTAPRHELRLEGLTIAAPYRGARGSALAGGKILLDNMSATFKAGEAIGIIGHTGSGKSTLARGITGIWPLARGHVRLDGADISQWTPEVLGKHIGYLPQDTNLLEGSIAENICRFDPAASSEKIIAAATRAGVHEMIVTLENGYQTHLGPDGNALSGGQRQRIALARALYDDPFLVILDEPNSNLDHAGDIALNKAIKSVKARGGICILITHRPSAIASCDTIGIIKQGRLARLGPKADILGSERNTNGKAPDINAQAKDNKKDAALAAPPQA